MKKLKNYTIQDPVYNESHMTDRFNLRALDREGLSAFPGRYAALQPPAEEQMPGFWKARFVGPAWLRVVAPPGLGLVGLSRWWGKHFIPEGHGENLVQRDAGVQDTLPFTWSVEPSRLDGRLSVVVRYPESSHLPWRWVVDELRQVDAQILLGMSLLRMGPRLALPFILERSRTAES